MVPMHKIEAQEIVKPSLCSFRGVRVAGHYGIILQEAGPSIMMRFLGNSHSKWQYRYIHDGAEHDGCYVKHPTLSEFVDGPNAETLNRASGTILLLAPWQTGNGTRD